MAVAMNSAPHRYRRILLMLLDMALITGSYILSWILIAGRTNIPAFRSIMVASGFFFVACYTIVFGLTGIYDSLWRYAEVVEFFRVAMSSAIAEAVFLVVTFFLFSERRIPIPVYVMSAMFAFILPLMLRLTYRMYRNLKLGNVTVEKKRVLLVGAGDAASLLLHELKRRPQQLMNVVVAVDDDLGKKGRNLMGVPIRGGVNDIPKLVKEYGIDNILLAIPTLTDERKKQILAICSKTNCSMQILPDINKLLSEGQDLVSRIREVKVEDLLGRPEIELKPATNQLITGKVVLVTGGGGSIGAELCRQIAVYHPKQLILLDIYENNAYEIQQQLLRQYGPELPLEVLVASVRDEAKIEDVFAEYRPAIVFHAAAHKHVPLMEESPEEAVKNNVFGTLNVARAAEKYKAQKFVLISTDKAVNPTSVMGATKRICEMIVQTLAKRSNTSFVAVRFGNVLGSNGSVIPLFKEQVEAGGPVTVTHPDIVRYFMTIPEAVRLVLEAASMGRSGNIMVLDMGEPIRILDLAENLIKMAGFTPYKDIPIVFTGLRPGEKLYEELMMDEEGLADTTHEKIFIGAPLRMDRTAFQQQLTQLETVAEANDSAATVRQLADIVPTFHSEQLRAAAKEVV